jgi:uncharacterized protein (TIGR03086 family)
MLDEHPTAAMIEGVGLLERAINYTRGSLQLVTPEALSRPTPCRGWDLRALVRHMNDSLAALHEAVDIGRVELDRAGDDLDAAIDPVATLRDRACRMLGAWTNARNHGVVAVAGHPLTSGIVTGTGAVEIAVHGWDVARACGRHRPIPAPLAEELLLLSRVLVTEADRPVRFAAPVHVPAAASPSDRLVAFLGRDPR